MLTHLDIRNFTIIPTLSLDFAPGMTVLTGETGAGKSIILNALSLALGARAKKNVVRDAKKPAEITLTFQIHPNSLALTWLQENQFEDGLDCIVRRFIHQDGRSRSTINGRSATLTMTKELADKLIHIHSQHQQQQLLKPSWQGDFLDHFAEHKKLLDETNQLAKTYQAIQAEIDDCLKNQKDHSHELDLIGYQKDELELLAPAENEWESLNQEYEILHQSYHIQESIQTTLAQCQQADNGNATEWLDKAVERLQALPNAKDLKNSIELFKNASIHCAEACDELQSIYQNIDTRQDKLTEIERRMEAFDTIARKHHVSPSELPQQLAALIAKHQQLTHQDEHLSELQQQLDAALTNYQQCAKKLSQSRKRAAKSLSAKITQGIQALNMPGSTFDIALLPRDNQSHLKGLESIQFLLSTQPQKPPEPLGEVASGGELSRITLTLMLATAESTQMPIFIFDEIDVGMGGNTAKRVGKLIKDLSENSQVFCITHLPQVAALGHHHFKVDKALEGEVMTSSIAALSKESRIQEIARMTTGDELTNEALAHASTLVE